MLFGRKLSRRNRNVLTGMVIVLTALAAVIYLFDLQGSDLLRFFVGSLIFVVGIILLALLAITLIKGLGWLLRRGRDD